MTAVGGISTSSQPEAPVPLSTNRPVARSVPPSVQSLRMLSPVSPGAR